MASLNDNLFEKVQCDSSTVGKTEKFPGKKPKRRVRKRRPKSRAPTYALTIVGKILYRRLKRNSFISGGVNLVRQISSCSLLGWSGILIKRGALVGDSKSDCAASCQGEGGEAAPSVSYDGCASLSGLIINQTCSQATRTSRSSTDPAGLASTSDLNSNVNARPVTSTCQESRSGVPERSAQVTTLTSRRTRMGKARKVVLYRGLVARSIGRPALRNRCRAKSKARGGLFGPLGKRGKRAMRDKMLLKLSTRLRSKVARERSTVTPNNVKVSAGHVRSPSRGVKAREDGSSERHAPDTDQARRRTREVTPARSEVKGNVSSRPAERKSRKWRALLSLGNTGISSANVAIHKPKRRRGERKQADAKSKQTSSHSASRSSITSAHNKTATPETVDWPALPGSSRVKVLAKETAEKIVKSKCSASVTKTGRRRWADIVKTPDIEQAKDKKKAEPDPEGKTWAAVVGGRSSSPCKGRVEAQAVLPGEVSGRADNPSSSKRRKKKAGYALACTDRIWLRCQASKASTHVENFYRREKLLNKRKSNVPGSPRKKTVDKGRPLSARRPESSPPSSSTRSRSCGGRQGPRLVATSSDRDVKGENACLVDNMPVVYTKRAGMVITLNESNHDRPAAHKDVNKCNNRVGGRDVTFSSQSGTDLCSQLSSMTFHTPTTSSLAVPDADKDGRDANSPASTLKSPRTAQSDVRPKKISLRYRELLRDSAARLDARAVSDIHTRSRRADMLQGDKAATRAMRRRARLERQNTTHNLRRGPAGGGTAAGTSSPTSSSKQRGHSGDMGTCTRSQGRQAQRQSQRQTHGRAISRGRSSAGQRGGNSATPAAQPASSVSVASASSSSSGDVTWRPSNNSAAHGSGVSPPGNVTLAPLRHPAFQDLLTPGLAKSAPQLSEPPANIRLDLNPNLQALDMRWWNAYLQQVKDQ